jgi:hypothetical protein
VCFWILLRAWCPPPIHLFSQCPGLHQHQRHRFLYVHRRPRPHIYGHISARSTHLTRVFATHVGEHAPITNRTSGCRCIAPSGHNTAAFFSHATWLQHTSLVVCSSCTNLRQSVLPLLRVVSSLQAVNFLVPENRCPRLSPHRLPCMSRDCPSMIDTMPPGSSLPNSSVISVLKETYPRCNNKLYYSIFLDS